MMQDFEMLSLQNLPYKANEYLNFVFHLTLGSFLDVWMFDLLKNKPNLSLNCLLSVHNFKTTFLG